MFVTNEKRCIYYEMVKLNRKKRKNYEFNKEKSLVGSRLGFNFTNVLRAQKLLADPKSAKKLLNLTVLFALLGSTSSFCARRTLVKLTPGDDQQAESARNRECPQANGK